MAGAPVSQRYVGIDVSKATLDVWILPDEEGFVVENTPTGFALLIARLEELGNLLIVLEATGSYHRKVTIALDAAGFTPAVINPSWLHYFGRSQGQRAKTDPGDARLLAAYAQREGATPRPVPSETTQLLTALLARRNELTKMLVMEKNRRHTIPDLLRDELEDHVANLLGRRQVIERQLRDLVAQDPFWTRRVAILRSIPGIGPVLSVTLAVRLLELGDLSRQELASLAGVAPHPRDSGTHRGRRTTTGGRRDVCKALYQGSVVMRSHNPPMRAHFEQLQARGKERNVALIAVARRSLGIMAAMVRDDLLWEETKVGQAVFLAHSA